MIDTTISMLKEHIGQTVRISGWLYNMRSSGKIRFLLVRDGTGLVQTVMVKAQVPDTTFDLFDQLTQESSLRVTGSVREEPRSPGGYELGLTDIEIVQIAEPYPITKKDHGVDFLHNNREGHGIRARIGQFYTQGSDPEHIP